MCSEPQTALDLSTNIRKFGIVSSDSEQLIKHMDKIAQILSGKIILMLVYNYLHHQTNIISSLIFYWGTAVHWSLCLSKKGLAMPLALKALLYSALEGKRSLGTQR